MSKFRIDPSLVFEKELILKTIEAIKLMQRHPITIKYWVLGGFLRMAGYKYY